DFHVTGVQTCALPIFLKSRLGPLSSQGLEYGESLDINGVKVSLHPAGHIIGSAQVRLEYKGRVIVVSGDYKLQDDGLSTPFEIRSEERRVGRRGRESG